MTFEDIKIGENFKHSGTIYVKKTSRTAYISKSRFFYFSKKEIIMGDKIIVNDNYYGV